MTRLGVFGGTFDPIHLGHLIVASRCAEALSLDRVLLVPAGHPPHKPDQPISDALHRVRMVRQAISGDPRFELDVTDVERAGPSYTSDLLELVAARVPGAALWFIMGADSVVDLSSWHDPGRILQLARIAAAARPGIAADPTSSIHHHPEMADRIDVVDVPLIGISASALRDRVRRGERISYEVPAAVERYIVAQRLYLEPR